MDFLIQQLPELAIKIWQQIYLVGWSMLLAIMLGIPLGIWISRHPKYITFTLSIANILWTIPSLALLAFLLPFFGIGKIPALITLTLYAILPIMRNTLTALQNISSEVIEVAMGLGFSQRQRLWIIDLPLALPTIVAGIRIAASIDMGIATLAAFIGAGGLGDFINRGLALNNPYVILLGAIPAAVLALLLDYFIGKIEKTIVTRKKLIKTKRQKFLMTGAMVCGLLLIGMLFTFVNSQLLKNPIRIATTNFTEQIILGELLAQMIEAKTNLKVDRKFNLGTSQIVHAALQKGEIDLYSEYTGTAYLIILKQHDNASSEKIYSQVKDMYQKLFHLTWLQPYGFNNTQALAMHDEEAEKFHIVNMSDLLPFENKIIFAAPAEAIARPDAIPGLKTNYQLNFKTIKQMEISLMYQAIHNKQVDLIMAFSTDGRIPAYHLKLLKDNKHFFPSYYAAPVIRDEILEKHPEILTAIKPLLGKLDEKTMQQLNYAVDIEKKSPNEVVRDFLRERKLIV